MGPRIHRSGGHRSHCSQYQRPQQGANSAINSPGWRGVKKFLRTFVIVITAAAPIGATWFFFFGNGFSPDRREEHEREYQKYDPHLWDPLRNAPPLSRTTEKVPPFPTPITITAEQLGNPDELAGKSLDDVLGIPYPPHINIAIPPGRSIHEIRERALRAHQLHPTQF